MSLRDIWPTLSPRERDAKGAEALGRTPETVIATPSVVYRLYKSPRIPPYSTTWEHAGPLLDRLRSEGWDPSLLILNPDRPYCELAKPRYGVIGAEGETFPEAVAFAFCLAMEAQP